MTESRIFHFGQILEKKSFSLSILINNILYIGRHIFIYDSFMNFYQISTELFLGRSRKVYTVLADGPNEPGTSNGSAPIDRQARSTIPRFFNDEFQAGFGAFFNSVFRW